MSNESAPKKGDSWLKTFTRVATFYFIGFTLFFIVGFAIISLRVASGEKIQVPDVTGKLYLEEHNSLQDAGFKVDIEKRNLVEYPYGYILGQSEPPGKTVKTGAKLTLVVNYSKKIIEVPQLTGLRLDLAEEVLSKIPVGDQTFALKTGTITEIPSDKPKGEVIAQFPEPGVTVFPEYPVSLLISSGNTTARRLSSLKGMQIELLKNLAYELKVPILLVKEETRDFSLDGVVASVDFGKNGNTTDPEKLANQTWKVTVYKFKNQWQEHYPNRYQWTTVKEDSVKGKAVTIAEKFVSSSGEVTYKNLGYVVITGELPVYISKRKNLAIWEGYYIPVQNRPQKISEDGPRPAFADEVEKENPEEVSPVMEIKLRTVQI